MTLDIRLNQGKVQVQAIYPVSGARPNFMKIASIARALDAGGGLDYRILRIRQHYDHEMNDVFFEELDIPELHVFMPPVTVTVNRPPD